jgi:hypothetical protein
MAIYVGTNSVYGVLALKFDFHLRSAGISRNIGKKFLVVRRKVVRFSHQSELDNVVDHDKQKVAAATADTENQFACDEHEEENLKNRISILKNCSVVMGYQESGKDY